jgi:hypothetical protein
MNMLNAFELWFTNSSTETFFIIPVVKIVYCKITFF